MRIKLIGIIIFYEYYCNENNNLLGILQELEAKHIDQELHCLTIELDPSIKPKISFEMIDIPTKDMKHGKIMYPDGSAEYSADEKYTINEVCEGLKDLCDKVYYELFRFKIRNNKIFVTIACKRAKPKGLLKFYYLSFILTLPHSCSAKFSIKPVDSSHIFYVSKAEYVFKHINNKIHIVEPYATMNSRRSSIFANLGAKEIISGTATNSIKEFLSIIKDSIELSAQELDNSIQSKIETLWNYAKEVNATGRIRLFFARITRFPYNILLCLLSVFWVPLLLLLLIVLPLFFVGGFIMVVVRRMRPLFAASNTDLG